MPGLTQNADFTIPDTICEDKPVMITNVQPANAISYKWSFCSGNASNDPDGTNIGNPNQILNAPRYVTFVKDSLDYYTFTTSTGNATVVRCYYGTSLTQFPASITNFGNFGTLTSEVTGIQVKKHNGTWYGFVCNGNKLLRLVFGPQLSNNTPVPQVISLPGVVAASGLAILQQGSDWFGFCTDIGGNNLVRLDFGTNPGSNPVITNLGNNWQLNSPAGIVVASENNNWYAFICNIGNSTLSRVSFGVSLSNPAPSGSAITNISRLNLNAGITLVNDCGGINGFVTNCVLDADLCIVRLVFANGLGGSVNGYQLTNQGILNKPYGISDFLRQGDTLFAFAANYGSSSLTRMFFPSCSGASQPFYVGQYPNPPVSYPDPGNYNILLTVDDALSVQSSKCRKIVVMPAPAFSLGPDRTICNGMTSELDAGAGNTVYAWSTGATTRKITVDTSGTYWVHVVNSWNCEADDTVKLKVNTSSAASVDTSVCSGLSYWAGQAWQTSSGVYYDTLKMATGCDSIVTTTLEIKDCPLLLWFPNAFTPDGDGVNDFFRPVGTDIAKYTLQIYNRWGNMIFESSNILTGWDGTVKGSYALPDVYTFVVVFESSYYPGVTHREAGSFTLVR